MGGAELEALLPGETVAVPVAVWFSGAGAPQRDDVTADVVTRLRDAIPQGARLTVHAAGIDTAGAVSSAPELLLPEMVGLPTPAAITFEASNGNLVNLDWLVADDAETYLGVTSFDELVERAAQQ